MSRMVSKETYKLNLSRESFPRRICDDLSEVLLKYLPLKDKYNFECVSKQFQRTIYVKHNELKINNNDGLNIDLNNINSFEIMVKKLPNIKSIICEKYMNETAFDLITKYCIHLERFKCDLTFIPESMKQRFLKKFSSQLKSISVSLIDIKLINNSLINIEEIEFRANNILGNIFEHTSRVNLKNLRKILFDLDDIRTVKMSKASIDEISKSMKIMIEKNKNITHISIKFTNFNEFLVKSLFVHISNLNGLISIKAIDNGLLTMYLLVNCLKQLKSGKLKSLSVKNCLLKDKSEFIDFLTEIQKFKNLMRLKIEFRIKSALDLKTIEDCLKGSLENSSIFGQLTHLKIGFFNNFTEFYNLEFKETFLYDFEKYLPRLKVFKFKNKINATEQTARKMSQLLNLEIISLNVINKSLRDLFIEKISKKCTKLKSIEI